MGMHQRDKGLWRVFVTTQCHLLAGNVFPLCFIMFMYAFFFNQKHLHRGVLSACNGIPHSKMFTLNNEMSDKKQFDLLL